VRRSRSELRELLVNLMVRISIAMKVSAASILTRKALVTRKFGGEAWRSLYRDVASTNPSFRRPLTAGALVPLPEYLAFHDELVNRFYPEGRSALFGLGAESARWALLEGPLKDFVRETDIDSLVAAMPKLWQRYFSETESFSEVRLCDSGVEFRVRALPAWHPYFEHFIVGYMRDMMEIYCANPVSARRLTPGRGTTYDYVFVTDPVADTASKAVPPKPRRARLRRARKALTDRELEVLRLVGVGKTNAEIGVLLHISQKTVQHHVAHIYDKLGVYSRAGATLWLAERGLAH
jgi:DNA-binding CsgD family transcriptional regulator